MIIIVNQHKTTVTSFGSYWDVFHHIQELEKPRQARRPQTLMPEWSFTIHPYHRALHFHDYIEETLKTGRGAKDDRRAFSILEIYQGNIAKPLLLPLMSNLNIEHAREEWCKAYLKERGFFSLQTDDLTAIVKPW